MLMLQASCSVALSAGCSYIELLCRLEESQLRTDRLVSSKPTYLSRGGCAGTRLPGHLAWHSSKLIKYCK